jgi:dihydrofolate reductase|tara:strand:- start:185 stop:628 length:444 start_codon:yes stop_codon:yes gene_type:complete
MDVILIAAITQDGFIARHENEIISWSKDLWLFKEQTMGHPLIVGSKTWACIKHELKGRDVIVVHRNDNAKNILNALSSKKCFIAGGGKTNTKFFRELTHLYLTPHPLLFGSGVRLFHSAKEEPNLSLGKIIPVDENLGIYQYQYKIN